jgi:agmatine deiminase
MTPTICMPAEWSRHRACLLLYPHNVATYRPQVYEEFHQVVRAIAGAGKEQVVLFCKTESTTERIRATFENDNVRVETCPSDDTWARDTAPTFVISNEQIVGLDWEFNAYGGPTEGCYWPCTLDQKVAGSICDTLGIPARKIPLVLEGGSIHSDGEGTILTTEECLLNPNRNPNKSKLEIEQEVLLATGATKMLWLPNGLDFDEDTNGHIDNWACFVRPGHVVLAWTENEDDAENYKRCRQALDVLSKETDAQGRSLTVSKLELPQPMYYTQEEVDSLGENKDIVVAPREAGERMAASYINFYIANAAVIVPQYGDSADANAISILQELFPDRSVIGVPSREILIGGGNIHCITQQLPEC